MGLGAPEKEHSGYSQGLRDSWAFRRNKRRDLRQPQILREMEKDSFRNFLQIMKEIPFCSLFKRL